MNQRSNGRPDLEQITFALTALTEIFGPNMDPDGVDNLDLRIADVAIPAMGLIERYFRARILGLEHLPPGRALVVGNHNSGITFLEPVLLGRAWYRANGGADSFRFLVHDAMVTLPVLGNLLMKCGAVRASRRAAEQVFAAGGKIVVFPGGNREAFRPFYQRHQIQLGGHKGFARMALRHRAPVVPMLNFGSHDSFAVLWRGEPLARLLGTDKLLRSPSFPLFLGLPWGLGLGPIFHLPLPVKMTIELGPPIDPDAMGLENAEDPEQVQVFYEAVETTLQQMMDRRAEQGHPA